jgi:hypothetical protein
MAGGNFDGVLFIFAGGIQAAQGPLTLDPNEVPIYVEAWVVQANTGAAASFFGNLGAVVAPRWIANVPYYQKGTFQPGPAVGTALVWARINPGGGGALVPAHFLWTDSFQLR